MSTVTINFIGGKPYVVHIPADDVARFLEVLKISAIGVTHLTGDDGLSTLINRSHITHVEVTA